MRHSARNCWLALAQEKNTDNTTSALPALLRMARATVQHPLAPAAQK